VTTIAPSIPVSGRDITGPPRDQRRSAKELGQYLWSQYQAGLSRRRPHAVSWLQVQSFLKGVHYFEIDDSGNWFPIERQPGEVRSIVPVIKPRYRHAMGILNSNELGISTVPVAGSTNPIYTADRARSILSHWIDEIGFNSVQDRWNQMLLTEGMTGLHRYVDAFRRQVFVRALPQSELFPIPFDAKSWDELHGLIHATMVTKQWLQMQDRLALRFWERNGRQGDRPEPMADRASSQSLHMQLDLPQIGASTGSQGRWDGALALTCWIRSNEEVPSGEYFFMIEDFIVRHAMGENVRTIMPDGQIPVEPIYFDKQPHSFWGTGLAELLLPSQFSMDRQMTTLEKNVRLNRPMTFYDTGVVDLSETQPGEEPSMIGFKGNMLEMQKRTPVFHFPGGPVNREVGSLISLQSELADNSAGMRSPILFGIQSGRTDSAAATTDLGQKAIASFQPVMKRTFEALDKTYPAVLDMIKMAWPDQKKVRVSGRSSLGKEILISRNDIPASDAVIIHPSPILAGGIQTMINILFQLKGLPGDDGVVGSFVKRGEFMRSLREANMLPPAIDTSSRAEARIQTRIDLLINDGVNPATDPADLENPTETQIMEDHRMAINMLQDVILDESFRVYGPKVRRALLQEIDYHLKQTHGATEHPDNVDDDLDKIDSMFTEEFLAAAEADLETLEGDFLSELGT